MAVGGVVPSLSAAAHRLPASEPPIGPRHPAATRTRVYDSRAHLFVRSVTQASRRGQTRREETTMTSDKARKTATRIRMAETGEPYSVARRAIEDDASEPPSSESREGESYEGESYEGESYEERYLREARE